MQASIAISVQGVDGLQNAAAEKKFKALSTSCCTADLRARWALSQSPSIGLLVGVRPSAAVARPCHPQIIETVYRFSTKVDYGILYSVNGLLLALRIHIMPCTHSIAEHSSSEPARSMQNSSDSRAFFGPVCAGAVHHSPRVMLRYQSYKPSHTMCQFVMPFSKQAFSTWLNLGR